MKQKPFVLCFSLFLWFLQVSMTDGCTNTKLVIVSKPGAITCSLATWYMTEIYWSARRPATGGKETRIAFCDGCAQSSPPCDCNTIGNDYSVTRTYSSDSRSNTTLYFVNNVRDNDESIIKCSNVYNTSCVEIKINVEDPGVPENVHVHVDNSLKVTGRADFVSSGDNVFCTWFYSSGNSTDEIVQGTTTLLNLTTFTDVNGLEYQRGTCTMTTQLNTSEMTYYFYVEIQPGAGPQFADSVTIKKPGTTLTTTCPDYVSEGSNLTCECSHLTAQHGNPPATISWRDVTDTAVLHVPSVSRNQSGTQFVCTSVWGAGTEEEVRSNHTYTLLVAYYTLPQCTDGRVDVSETEPWTDITCDGVASSHSMNWTLTGDNGQVTEIAKCYGNGTCTTTNDDVMVFKNKSASTLTFVKNVRQRDNQTLTCVKRNGRTKASCLIRTLNDDPESFPWVVVGVVVGAAVLVIIIVIAIVVARRRASRKGAVENNPEQNATDDDFEEHINDLYQSSDTPPLADQCPPTSALQAYATPQVTNTVNADPNGIQEMTQTAQPDDVYNVLGFAPCGDQKDDAVYNHLTKF